MAVQLTQADRAALARYLARLKASRQYTTAQKQTLWRRALGMVTAARAKADAKKKPPARPGPSTVRQVEGTIHDIANNPLVQGGLDAAGSIFGDPELGQQVAQGVNTAIGVVNALGDILPAVGDFIGGQSMAEQAAHAEYLAEHPSGDTRDVMDVTHGLGEGANTGRSLIPGSGRIIIREP